MRSHDDHGFSATFQIDEFTRHCLLEGLDDIGLTLKHETEITAYEARHPAPTKDYVGAGALARAAGRSPADF